MKGTIKDGSSATTQRGTSSRGETVKLVLLGDTTPTTNAKGNTLRTALANIFAGGQGKQNNRTIKRTVAGRNIDVSLQDIGGQETQSHKLNTQNYSGTDTFVLTFGYESRPSFEGIKTWYNEAKRSAPKATLVLLGVKTGNGSQVVTPQDAQQLAKELNINTFAECSLDNPQSIEKVFDKAISLGTQHH